MSELPRRRRVTPSVPLPYDETTANRTLPLVRRIVHDLTGRHALWQAAVSGFEYATIGSAADAPDADAERFQADAQRLAREIDDCLVELDALGIECRDPARGVVAFPGRVNGLDLAFTWMPGDAAVYNWASENGTSNSEPSRAQEIFGNTSFASRSKSDGSRE